MAADIDWDQPAQLRQIERNEFVPGEPMRTHTREIAVGTLSEMLDLLPSVMPSALSSYRVVIAHGFYLDGGAALRLADQRK